MILKPLRVISERRGKLIELFDDEIDVGGYVYSFSVAPGFRRGDHFHLIKKEWAVCISGEIQVLTKAPGKAISTITLTSINPEVVYFPPLTAHTFVNVSDREALIVSYGSKRFDQNDPDTYPMILREF